VERPGWSGAFFLFGEAVGKGDIRYQEAANLGLFFGTDPTCGYQIKRNRRIMAYFSVAMYLRIRYQEAGGTTLGALQECVEL